MLALKMAGAFGGGIARQGEVCGAVSGAIMAIGLKYGKYRADDQISADKTYRLTQEFLKDFRKRHTHIRCNDLLGFDISTEAGVAKTKELDTHNTVCLKLVRDAAEIADTLLK